MKCPECSLINKKDGRYCRRCGTALDSGAQPQKTDDLSDVIFTPKKKSVSFGNILLLLLIFGVVGFLGLIWLASSDSGSASPAQNNAGQQLPLSFPIEYLEIEDADIEWHGEEPYFVGVLKNRYSRTARDVAVRLDFYRDQTTNRHFDTRRTVIEYGVDARGAFSFQVPLSIYPSGQFWYTWEIESAKY